MDTTKIKVDGTYPFEGAQEWTTLLMISFEEASKITGIPHESIDAMPSGKKYLWLNKGYKMIGPHAADKGCNTTTAIVLECFFGACEKRWPVGAQAVYNCDGTYYIIERTGK